jgi:Mrp family chromosome partitioning ATPase
VTLDRRHLARQRVIAADRVDPAHVAFDVLRTRLLQTLRARGWRRVAITSPTQGCGKTFVAANLALSLSRRASCRTVLMDLDLRIPSLAAVLGVCDVDYLHPFLAGKQPAEAHLVRPRPNLALGLNAGPVFDAAELLQEPATAQALMEMQAALEPDVVLYDLPPTLACDDVIAFLPQVDGVLLVAGGGITQAEDVRKCERLFADQAPLIGVILNMAEDPPLDPYYAMT